MVPATQSMLQTNLPNKEAQKQRSHLLLVWNFLVMSLFYYFITQTSIQGLHFFSLYSLLGG